MESILLLLLLQLLSADAVLAYVLPTLPLISSEGAVSPTVGPTTLVTSASSAVWEISLVISTFLLTSLLLLVRRRLPTWVFRFHLCLRTSGHSNSQVDLRRAPRLADRQRRLMLKALSLMA